MQAYLIINCNTGSENRLISEFKELPEITEINGVWGKHDIILKIETYDTRRVDEIVKRIRNHPDVVKTDIMHVLYGQGGSIDQETDV